MDNDELNSALRALCDVLAEGGFPESKRVIAEMAIEAVIDQIRFRATGSPLASKVPA
jgi:hypothetical protein